VTGWGQEEDRKRALATGFDEHMVKPIDPPALMRFLATIPHERLDAHEAMV
jgi:CheY-like chemotaxis protein